MDELVKQKALKEHTNLFQSGRSIYNKLIRRNEHPEKSGDKYFLIKELLYISSHDLLEFEEKLRLKRVGSILHY